MKRHPPPHSRASQRGLSLFVVLVMALLTSLLVLWGARTALFNEMITGTDSDYQRALEAAQAMVRDAEFDIMGRRADGTPCGSEAENPFTGCRPASDLLSNINVAAGQVFFPPPSNQGIYEHLQEQYGAQEPRCVAAVCIAATDGTSPTGSMFWTTAAEFTSMTDRAATYGQYTGAKASDAGGEHNALLATGSGVTTRAWYWIEPLRYQRTDSATSAELAPVGGSVDASATGIVYRITAVALGRKAGTRAVIQTVFVRKEVAG